MTQPTLSFTHPVLTPITTKPTYASLKQLQREIYANACAIKSMRGGGTNGYLALVMPTPAYLARAGTAFDPPIHPGAAPATVARTALVTKINRRFLSDIKEHTQYTTVAEELKKQILAAVPNTYLAILANDEMGYAATTCGAMLAHLQTTYGIVTAEDIEENRKTLTAPWNPDWPQEDVRIHNSQTFAAANKDPITQL
jgi:hypothetical protein